MRTEWVFRRCPRYLRRQVENHWFDRQYRIQKLVSHFERNVCELQINMQKLDQPRMFEGRMVLRLPTATIRVETRDADALAVINQLMDQLVRRIKRHVERLQKCWPARRARANRAALPASGLDWIEQTTEAVQPELTALASCG